MRWFLALSLVAACKDKVDDNCVTWTESADACLEQAGMEPAFVAGIDCADLTKEDFHSCMVIAWNGADCSTQASVEAVETGPAYECTQ